MGKFIALLGLTIFAFWGCLMFFIGFKFGKRYEATFYLPKDRVVEDD